MVSYVLFVLIVAVLTLGLDYLWLSLTKSFYTSGLSRVAPGIRSPRWAGAVIAYAALVLGHITFVPMGAPITGAIYGAVVYGVYNGTIYATFSNYGSQLVVVDTAWGAVLNAVVSLLAGILVSL